MDLHFVRPGGMPFAFDGSDCYFARMAPDWGRAGDTTDNPFLDRDDTNGPGPENINLSSAAPGDYQVSFTRITTAPRPLRRWRSISPAPARARSRTS